MEHGVWTFSRGSVELALTRQIFDDGIVLSIAGGGPPRSYFFSEVERLETFQRDMETLLLKTGWTFISFAPQRRSGRDRRGFPRVNNDRRRWWTDGRPNAAAKGTPSPTPAKAGLRADIPQSSEKNS